MAKQWGDSPSASSTSATIGILDIPDDAVVIAVMGLTGAGKSYFIQQATGLDTGASSSLKSATQKVTPYLLLAGDRKIVILDSPGFDDSERSDAVILQMIASWMTYLYKSGKALVGIIYVQDMLSVRVGRSSRMSMKMFQEMCGVGCLRNVILLLNKCALVPAEVVRSREKEYREDFWSFMIANGSSVEKFEKDTNALQIVLSMCYNKPIVTNLALELVELGINLSETSAGKVVCENIEDTRKETQNEMSRTKNELQDAIRNGKQETQRTLEKERRDYDTHLNRLATEQRQFKTWRLPPIEQVVAGLKTAGIVVITVGVLALKVAVIGLKVANVVNGDVSGIRSLLSGGN